jgi:hypothetical protein
MIWLAWRQFRKPLVFTAIGLGLLAALMIPAGLAMHTAFDDNGVADCVAGAALLPENCIGVINQFNTQYRVFNLVGLLFIFLPLFVGLFWGAPLVAREVEHGTHRLVWTQGISRRHWALVKFAMVGGATIAVATAYGLGVSWYLEPLSHTGQSRFNQLAFDIQGVAPVGYTVFAVALGICAGTIWQRVLPAMAVTLAGFVGLRLAVTALARPRFATPETFTYPVQGPTVQPDQFGGDWVLGEGIRNASGEMVMDGAQAACPPGDGQCGADLGAGAYNWLLYHPADRFWLFQGIETSVYLVMAGLLLYLAVRRIQRIA